MSSSNINPNQPTDVIGHPFPLLGGEGPGLTPLIWLIPNRILGMSKVEVET